MNISNIFCPSHLKFPLFKVLVAISALVVQIRVKIYTSAIPSHTTGTLQTINPEYVPSPSLSTGGLHAAS
jgi:hypothetical protein